jgi:hypothetical protein
MIWRHFASPYGNTAILAGFPLEEPAYNGGDGPAINRAATGDNGA